MFCRNCGKEVSQNAVACMNCGCAPTIGDKFCPNCGQAINKGQVVCIKCGTALNQAQQTTQGTKSRTTAALLAFFLGAFGAHEFYLGNMASAGIRLGVTLIGGMIGLGFIMCIIGIIEAIMYWTKSDEQFYATYVIGKKQWF